MNGNTLQYLFYRDRISKLVREYGYACTIHGSCKRDLDLVLIPWVENAISPNEILKIIETETGLVFQTAGSYSDGTYSPEIRPFGRKTWVALLMSDDNRHSTDDNRSYIDLSIMPKCPTIDYEKNTDEKE